MNAPRESIRKRYVATLLSKVIQMILGVVEASFVPRALGPGAYGSFSFLMASASNFRNSADLGAQQMVFTVSSKSERTGALTKLYGLWLVIQILALLALIGVFAWTGKINWLWPKQRVDQVVIITLLEWLTYVAARIAQIGESKGLTVKTQITTAVISLGTAFVLVGMAAWHQLEFRSYVEVLVFSALLNAAIYSVYLFTRSRAQLWDEPIQGMVHPYLRQWWNYSSPLVASTVFAAFASWLDIYLIQRLYGPKEQGFFALSSAISAGVFVFTGSSISIYWREIAYSLGQNNRARAAQIHLMFSRLLFFLTLSLSVWLCFHAHVVVSLMAGHAFQASIPILMIMSFAPLQQTHGQMNHSVLLASGHTVQFRNLEIALSIPGLLASYFMLAPHTAWLPGLGLGAIGIALKIVVYGMLSVQFYEYRVCKILDVSYSQLLLQKISMALLIAGIGGTLLFLLPRMISFNDPFHGIIHIAIASSAYLATLLAIIYRWPHICGMDREHIKSVLKNIGISSS